LANGIVLAQRQRLVQDNEAMKNNHRLSEGRTSLEHIVMVIAVAAGSLAVPAAEIPGAGGAPPDDEYASLAELPLEQVAKIEVTTATQTPVIIGKAPSTIYSFTAEDLRQRGVRDLLQLVNFHVPGAFVTEDGDELIAAFRGVAVDNNCKVMFLIDGHNANLQWAKGATPELELGLIEDIERVEIIVGPGSALYGSGATISVINVITKPPPEESQEMSARVGVGNGGYVMADSSIRARLGRNWAITASGGAMQSSGFCKINSAGVPNDPLNVGRYLLNARGSIRLNYGDYTEIYARYDTVSRAIWNNNVNPARVSPCDTFDYAFIEARQAVPLGDLLNLKLAASHDTFSDSKHDYYGDLKTRAVGEDHTAASARLFYIPNDEFSLIGGGEYRYDQFGNDWAGENFNFNPTYDPTNGIWTGVTPDYAHRMLTPYNRNEVGVFAQASFQLFTNLNAFAGARYDYVEAPRVSREHSVTPRVALVYTPTPKLTTRLMYHSSFRQPMAVLTTPDGFFLGGLGTNRITKPETIQSIELSASCLVHPNLNLTLNTFYNRFENPHSLTTDPATSRLLFTQGGTVDFVGFEAFGHYRLVDKVSVLLGHQFVKLGAEADDPFNTFKAPTERTIMFYPENVTKGMIEWRVSRIASVNLNGLFVYQSLGYTPAGDVAKTGGYGILNANLVMGNPRRLGQVSLSVNNLLDDKTRVPMPATVGRPSDMVPMGGVSVVLSYHKTF
jgi:iron complex outermembrane receptor protein